MVTPPAPDAVHVWYGVGGGEHTARRADVALLGREEKLRGARIARDEERVWFFAARAGARRALAEHLRVPPERIGLRWDPASDFRAARLTGAPDTPGTGAPVVAVAHHGHRWLLALAPYGPLALAVGAPGPPSDAAARLRAVVRRTAATARAPHLPRAALAVADLPDHGPAPVALAHHAALGVCLPCAAHAPHFGRSSRMATDR
ncbi:MULTISPECIES: hypothetical protein [unclassified Streptomyces]|uniref:hypothetical protein n=1 Tax=unclassified Streptomyces TaxID=2593676 RepID=UPI00225A9A33|nr:MULTISPECIES: hypothetical protein [unclassified Streptomyces]MCX4527040.1 hypothetical protein [Streptomyces sp. NBC_01551]MCX4542400.1 hypothetical protein [Streptomyces sp. NBC_01565]